MSNDASHPLRAQLDALTKISDKNGAQYWCARDLWEPLGYAKWESFAKVIARAMEARREAGRDCAFHFRELTTPAGDADFRLTRLACHLITMAGDGRKKTIAFAKAYFAETASAKPEAKPASRAEVKTKPKKAVAPVAKVAAKPKAAPQKPAAVTPPAPSAKPTVKSGSRFIPQAGGRFHGSTQESRNSRWNPNCAVSRGYHNRAASNGR